MSPTVSVSGRKIKLSKMDKELYPDDGVTKGDLVGHYHGVADVMVPHIRGRPLTLRRFPDGIYGESWFQKEASTHFPDWIRVEDIPQRGDNRPKVRHVICDDAATLIYLANQAAIEFHIWTSTADSLESPDLMVIDLDPPNGSEAGEIRSVARRVRDLYREIGLTPYLQATGGRGFHIVAPLDRTTSYGDVRALARDAADYLAAADQDRLTTQLRKEKRGKRIFLDTNRNGYAQTFIAPYSLRSRPGAAVATPLDWAELGRTAPDGFGIEKLRRRLAAKSDPWRNMADDAASAQNAHARLREFG